MIEVMKKALFVLFFLLNHLVQAECIYCRKFHTCKYICLPKAHFYFLQKKNFPNLRCSYTQRILDIFRKQKIKTLEKCKRLQKVFLSYCHAKKGLTENFIPKNVYEGRWLCFFNMYVKTQNELILFNMALHIHAKQCVEKSLNKFNSTVFYEFN